MVTIQMQWERGVGRAFMFHREKEKQRCEWNNVLLERWKATKDERAIMCFCLTKMAVFDHICANICLYCEIIQ